MIIHRVTLPALALGLLLVASASGQAPHSMGTMGSMESMGAKLGYDPEPRGGDPAPPPNCAGVDATVTIVDTSYSPATVTIDPGQPVCWTWTASVEHTVKADDESFTSGNPSSHNTFQHTFTTPGTYGYYCQVHGSLTGGMRGTVVVRDAGNPGGGDQGPGTLGFTVTSYEVSEGAGAVTLTVERAGGSDGAASIKFATANGTAKSGKDFITHNGTLKWDAGDEAPKTIDVAIKNDHVVEPDKAFSVKLSKATGATLGASVIATVTIHDDDGTGCGASSTAASQLRAVGQSASEIRLTWADAPAEAKAIHVERRPPGGTFQEIAAVAAGAESFTDSALPGGAEFQYRVRTEAVDGSSAVSEIAAAATHGRTTPCDESGKALCLGGGRFEATVTGGRDAKRMVLPEAGNSGLFALSSHQDLQLLLNVHDGCAANNHYWLDLAAVTEAEFTVRVRDTQTGHTWVYFHPAGRAPAPVRDVEAFAVCP
ncbi:MAG: Calx-beta domain-containing protein [Thermoanaerobaculia bacterium]